jgi:hypothetical protein
MMKRTKYIRECHIVEYFLYVEKKYPKPTFDEISKKWSLSPFKKYYQIHKIDD